MLTNKRYVWQCTRCGSNVETQGSANDAVCPDCGSDDLKPLERYGTCSCGEEIEFSRFTNTCDCGRDYNWAGDQLAPREQWGAETGESLSEILSVR